MLLTDFAAVADVDGENTGGFSTDGSNITGFSALHDSGTGGNPSLGNFPIFPQLCSEDDINSCKFPIAARATHYKNDSVEARPGYFGIELENGIHADMAVAEHSALFRFDFSAALSANGSAKPVISLDLTDLWKSRQNASISVEATEGSDTGRMKGDGTFLPSFGAGSYKTYFCLDVAGGTVEDSGLWVNDRAGSTYKQMSIPRGFNLFYLQAGGYLRFCDLSDSTLTVRMGLSFISTNQACQNAEAEIPGPEFDFDSLVNRAEDAWRAKLAPISIEMGDVDDSFQTNFWSAVYRTMMSPQNCTGENPHWQSSEPYFDSFYCIWDMWRVQLPFLTVLDPKMVSNMVRSLLDTYKHRGWLPDCMMSTCKGWTQGGSDADNVIVDAYVKNITGIDWNLAYEAILNDAENEPREWNVEGRGGLTSWKNVHYIPYLDFDPIGFGTNSRSISRTLEYSYNDFNLATLARGLAKNTTTTYLSRATNWQNLFKADQTSFINSTNTTFTGFFQPKYFNGTWGYQDPIACSPLTGWCSLTGNPSETFESSIWEYMFFVPHDVGKLIELLGGDEMFVRRLETFHTSGLADPGNEPVFLTVYVAHYAGRPGLSAKLVHQCKLSIRQHRPFLFYCNIMTKNGHWPLQTSPPASTSAMQVSRATMIVVPWPPSPSSACSGSSPIQAKMSTSSPRPSSHPSVSPIPSTTPLPLSASRKVLTQGTVISISSALHWMDRSTLGIGSGMSSLRTAGCWSWRWVARRVNGALAQRIGHRVCRPRQL